MKEQSLPYVLVHAQAGFEVFLFRKMQRVHREACYGIRQRTNQRICSMPQDNYPWYVHRLAHLRGCI